jgi:hypothetical protein
MNGKIKIKVRSQLNWRGWGRPSYAEHLFNARTLKEVMAQIRFRRNEREALRERFHERIRFCERPAP